MLQNILTITSDATVMQKLSGAKTVEMICENMGIDPEHAELFSLRDLSVIYFDYLLHEIYDQAGHADI